MRADHGLPHGRRSPRAGLRLSLGHREPRRVLRPLPEGLPARAARVQRASARRRASASTFRSARHVGRRGDHRARAAAPDRARGRSRAGSGGSRTRAEYTLTPADHDMTRVEYRFETDAGNAGRPAEGGARAARLAAPRRAAGRCGRLAQVLEEGDRLRPRGPTRRLDRLPRSWTAVRKLPLAPRSRLARGGCSPVAARCWPPAAAATRRRPPGAEGEFIDVGDAVYQVQLTPPAEPAAAPGRRLPARPGRRCPPTEAYLGVFLTDRERRRQALHAAARHEGRRHAGQRVPAARHERRAGSGSTSASRSRPASVAPPPDSPAPFGPTSGRWCSSG